MKTAVFWFLDDLRTTDNKGLFEALSANETVLPLFIYQKEHYQENPLTLSRLKYILEDIDRTFNLNSNSHLLINTGTYIEVFQKLLQINQFSSIYYNQHPDPAIHNKQITVTNWAKSKNIEVFSYTDYTMLPLHLILKPDGTPYKKFTPYKNNWLKNIPKIIPYYPSEQHLSKIRTNESIAKLPVELNPLKAQKTNIPSINKQISHQYDMFRDYPHAEMTTHASIPLRFGIISIRQLIAQAINYGSNILNELIWREFFKSILFHFPHTINRALKKKYDNIIWLNDDRDFNLWCRGLTGYPIIDAGMRQLNQTGEMHNRVRMITSSFLTKHLLIDWRWGATYFASKLIDYDCAVNTGNWQWVAGSGADAVPYFRIFNPALQQKKFDPDFKYIKQWVSEFGTTKYPSEIIEHHHARQRAIKTFKLSLPK